MNRRQFLRKAGLASGALFTAPRVLQTSENVQKIPLPTDPIPFGRTGIQISRVGMGTGTVGYNKHSHQTRLGQETFTELVQHAYDRGITFFDLADQYGSHPFFAQAMKDAGIPREKVVICTKIWLNLNKDEVPDGVLDRFRQELDTDYLDIVLLQCMMEEDWPEKLKPWLDYLEEAKQKKIIRAHGVSNHTLGALKAAVDSPWVDCILARINPQGKKMDGPPEVVVPMLKKAHASGKGVAGMKILAQGYIILRRKESLRFVLGLGCVDSLIIGFERKEEIDDILGIMAGILQEPPPE